MELKINEVAKLTGVTVRTLHYYDEIGLLKPSRTTDAGYRIYNDDALERLQQILFFRELEFPLGDIQKFMEDPCYDRKESLQKHRDLLIRKKNRLEGLITLVERTLKGESDMSFAEFDTTELETYKQKYADEVKARWGNTDAYREYADKTQAYSEEQWQSSSRRGEALLRAFGENRHLAPDSTEAQALVRRWQNHITESYYACTKEILACLGQMYVNDARFTENIDQNGVGTAAFMAQAIAVYCTKAEDL